MASDFVLLKLIGSLLKGAFMCLFDQTRSKRVTSSSTVGAFLFGGFFSASYRVLFGALLGALLTCLLCVTMGAFPLPAYASQKYASEELATNITINPDASVSVVSRQVLEFSGENEGVVWYLGVPVYDETVKVTSVSVAPVDDGGALLDGWTYFQPYDVDKETQGSSPGDTVSPELRGQDQYPWYSYSIFDGMARCWFPTSAGRYVIQVKYDIDNCVSVYRDVAELNWRYAHASYPVDMHDITLLIELPMPDGASAVAGQDVYAWGHGPDDGWFRINEDDTVVYHFDSLEAGRYADAHIMFPASWMTNMSSTSPRLFTETQKSEILQQESLWVDSGTRGQNWDFKVRMLFLGIAAVVLLVGVVGVLRFGLSTRSRRLLIRIAAILACTGLAVSLFFWEPLSEWCLFGLAAVVALVSLLLPKEDPHE